MTKNGDVALRINTTIYYVDFYFLKQYIVYKIFSATAPFFKFYLASSDKSSNILSINSSFPFLFKDEKK